MNESDQSARPREGEVLDVAVERAVYRGQGLARHRGQVVFVPRGLPGDRLRVRVASLTPGYVKAEIEQVEAKVKAKQSHAAAAASVFKR